MLGRIIGFFVKSTVLAIVIVLVVLATFIFAGPYVIPADKITAKIEKEFYEHTNIVMDIQGVFNFAILPNPSFEAKNVVFAQGGKAIKVPGISAELSLKELILERTLESDATIQLPHHALYLETEIVQGTKGSATTHNIEMEAKYVGYEEDINLVHTQEGTTHTITGTSEINGTPIQIDGTFKLNAVKDIQLALATPLVDIDFYKAMGEDAKKEFDALLYDGNYSSPVAAGRAAITETVTEVASADGAVPSERPSAAGTLPKDIKGKISFDAERVIYEQKPLANNFYTKVDYTHPTAKIDGGYEAFEGKASAVSTISEVGNNFEMQKDFKLEGVDIHRLLEFVGSEGMSGTLDASGSVKSKGTRMEQLLRNIQGQAKFKAVNGMIDKLAENPQFVTLFGSKIFDEASGTINVAEQRVSNNDLVVRYGKGKLKGDGILDLGTYHLRYNVGCELPGGICNPNSPLIRLGGKVYPFEVKIMELNLQQLLQGIKNTAKQLKEQIESGQIEKDVKESFEGAKDALKKGNLEEFLKNDPTVQKLLGGGQAQ